MRRLAAAAIVTLQLAHAGAISPPPQEPAAVPLEVLLPRVFAYVERFTRAFSGLVSEERYEQVLRQTSAFTRSGDTRVVLRSDVLLVNVPGQGWLPFRDVFEANGRLLRDREDRLAALFLKGTTDDALRQARRLMDESARFNIGNGTRNFNVPTLAMMFLVPEHRAALRFAEGRPDRDHEGRVITFDEVGRPTLISTTGNRDLPVSGRLWIDEATGTILRSEVQAADADVDTQVTVTFGAFEGVDVHVPLRMEERFRRRRESAEVRGVATYSRFRRFQVSTSEDVQEPEGAKP